MSYYKECIGIKQALAYDKSRTLRLVLNYMDLTYLMAEDAGECEY